MNRRRYLNYISTLNTLQDTNINFKKLIPTAVYNNSRPNNNKNLIGDININITLPSGFVAQNSDVPIGIIEDGYPALAGRSMIQEPISEVFQEQNIPDEPLIPTQQNVLLDTPENRTIIFESERDRRRIENARLRNERETRSIARRERNLSTIIHPTENNPLGQQFIEPSESDVEFHRLRLNVLQNNNQRTPSEINTERLINMFNNENVRTDYASSQGISDSERSTGSQNYFNYRFSDYSIPDTRPNTPFN